MISAEYKEINRQLHEKHPEYGVSGSRYVEFARPLSNWGRKPILDYGCGKAILAHALGPAYRVTNYDPCISGMDTRPEPHPVVMCTDVMEHVEPEFVDDVLKDIRGLATEYAMFAICKVEAVKVLEDGRNAHLSQHPYDWWKERLEANGFEVVETINEAPDKKTFRVICK